MRARLADESGVSLVELVITMLFLGIIVAALSGVFVSGLRASSDSNARVAGMQETRTAIDRLEFEARCSSGATVSTDQTYVTLTLPSQCSHATGTYTWCVQSGSLLRYTGSTCTGSGQVFASELTTAAPFTLLTTSGLLPRLQIAISASVTGGVGHAISVTDTITLRNAARTA